MTFVFSGVSQAHRVRLQTDVEWYQEALCAQVIKSNDVPLSKQEVLVIASGGTPEAAVAAIMLGFKKAASPTHYAHTQTTPCTTALRLAPHA